MDENADKLPLISIIIPVKNSSKYLDESIPSIWNQSYKGPIELSIYDDGSEDDSVQIINKYIPILQEKGIQVVFRTRAQVLSESHSYQVTTGAAFARNRAIEQSHGDYICLLDSDDILTTVDQYSDSTEKVGKRLELQLKAALEHPDYLIGCNFLRIPEDGTPRYTQWCNRLTQEELYLHQYRECTIVQPTWFFSRKVYNKVGGYDESEVGLPEDLIFFHKHLDMGGGLYKVQEPLIVYRYHSTSTSYKIHRLKLLEVRIKAFENRVLSKWDSFTIWGAGRDGCKFFGSLSMENRKKLVAFCDVDVNKVGTIYHQPYTNLRVPVIHFSEAKPPLVLCVAIDRTNGVFEQNVASLGLKEGVDYWHFH